MHITVAFVCHPVTVARRMTYTIIFVLEFVLTHYLQKIHEVRSGFYEGLPMANDP